MSSKGSLYYSTDINTSTDISNIKTISFEINSLLIYQSNGMIIDTCVAITPGTLSVLVLLFSRPEHWNVSQLVSL